MSNENLTTYLNDHHAGSVGAVELVDNLIETFEGKPLEQFFKNLLQEIKRDQATLESLIKKVGAEQSGVKKAGAWVAEKFSRAKMRVSDSAEDQLGFLHALEGLVLGIAGKKKLWCTLEAASENLPSLRTLDYERLKKRAQEQSDLVEAKRLEIAREVFRSEKS